MDEFAAVGEAVGDFASDNALVVMGTAIDESMGDELRVTVVATGLGQLDAKAERDMRLVVSETPAAAVDYKQLDRPTGDAQAIGETAIRGCGAGKKIRTIWIFRPFCAGRRTRHNDLTCPSSTHVGYVEDGKSHQHRATLRRAGHE